MSKTIDERVVSMQFDNKQFESNVKTTMSTLEKLKQSLNLKGATKGLEEVDAAAKKVNLTPLADSTNVVVERFSIMGSAVNRVIENMVDQAYNAGKRMVSALTIDPISTGLSEYETKINAIQVIKANTRAKYSSEIEQMNAINSALSDLNDYADRTIYNFAQMTDNVGKFVAQGLDIDEAAKAVEGMANLAGASGASAQDMARATYQMSQALGGVIRKIDWNSLRTANMASVELKNTLMDIARVRGINIDGMISNKGTFEDTLEEGWLTGELFTEAMNIYSDVYSEAELRAKGFNDAQVTNFKALAKSAREATTEVKTVSQLWDVLKETAQSGWTQSWEILFGDFNTAKETFTKLQNYFSAILNNWSEVRNTILGGIFKMEAPWASISEKLEASGLGKIAELGEKIADVTHKLEDFQDIVTRVWSGEFGNADTGRFEKLEELGWDHQVIQDLVNKGLEYELTIDDIEASHKKFGKTLNKTSTSVKKMIDPLADLTDEQLRNAGLTQTEINLFRDLEREAERTGITISELVANMSENDGRTLMIESFKNAWAALVQIFESVKYAWSSIFPPVSVVRIYSIIDAIHDFTEKLKMAPHTAGLLTRTFKGLFAALDLIGTVLTGPIKLGFKILQQFLGAFDLDLLTVTAKIGDAIVEFNNWVDSTLDFTAVFERIAPVVKNIVDYINGFVGSIKDLIPSFEAVKQSFENWCNGVEGYEDLPQRIGEKIGRGLADVLMNIGKVIANIIKEIVSVITGIPIEASDEVSDGAMSLGLSIIKGIVVGIAKGIRFIVEAIIAAGKALIDSFANVIDSHSPSKVFIAFGGFIVAGLVLGILSGIPAVVDALSKVGAYMSENFGSFISTIGDKIRDFFQNIDLSKTSSVFWGISSLIPTANILNIIAAFTGLASSFGVTIGNGFKTATEATKTAGTAFGETFVKVFNVIKKVLSGIFTFLRDNFGSIVALIGGFMLVQTVTKLANVVLALTSVVSKVTVAISGMFKSIGKSFELVGKGVFILLLAFAIKELATAFVTLADLSWPQIGKGAAVIGGLAILMTGLAIAIGLFAKKTKAFDIKSIAGIGIVMLALAASIGILVYSLTLMDKVDDKRIWKHLGVIAALAAGMAIIGVIMSKVKGEVTTGSLAMIAISAAILILVFALTKLNALTITDPQKTITALVALAGGLALVALMSKGISSGAAIGMIGMVLSIFLFTKLLERLAKSEDAIMSGLGTVILILGMFAGLMLATRLISWDSGNDMAKVCSGILMLSLALILVVGAMRMLNKLDASGIAKGLIVVSVVMALFVAIIAVSKFAGEHAMRAGVMLTMMATAMLILVGAIWLLALIGRDNVRGLEAATVVVLSVMTLFTIMIHASQYAQKSMGAIIALTVAISAMVVAIGILTLLAKDPATLWQAVGVMTAIIVLLSLLMYSVKFITSNADSMLKTVVTLGLIAGLLVVLALVIKHVASIPAENATAAVNAIATLLAAMATVCVAAALIGKFKETDIGVGLATLYALTPLLDILGVIIQRLQGIDTQQALGMVMSLSAMILALSVVALACAAVGKIAGKGAFMGVIVLDALIISLLAIVGGIGELINKTEWAGPALETGLETIKKITSLFSEMAGEMSLMITAVLAIAAAGAVIGKLAGGYAFLGIFAIDVMIASLLAIMLGLGELINKTEWAGPALDTAIEFIKKLATGLGEALGSFVSSIGTEITAGMIQMGDDLSTFADKIVPFLESMKGLSEDTSALKGVTALAKMISSLAGANIKTALSSGIFGSSGLDNLASQLVPFGNAIVAFSEVIGNGKIDADAVEAAAKAGSMMADLQNALPKTGGRWQEWFGETDFTAFTAQLVPFGHAMVQFSDVVAGKIDTEAVQAAADAGAIMSELQNGLPKEYGKISGLFASNPIPLDTFGGQLVHFGRAMIMFSEIVSNGEINKPAIQAASDAAKIMTALANELPEEHGVIKSWFTDNTISLDTFGSQLVLFGRAIISFSRIVSNGVDQGAIEAAAVAGETMSTLAKNLPEETGWLKSWFSDNTMSMSDFGDELVEFGEAIVDFSETISGNIDLTAITTASNAASGITNVLRKTPRSVHIESFKTAIKEFGTAMIEFSETIEGGISSTDLTVVTSAALRLAEAAAIMPDSVNLALLTNGLTEYGEAIKTFSNQMKDGAVDLEAVDIATKAGKSITDMVAAIPPDADYAGFATNIAGIGTCLVKFSDNVKEGSIDTSAIETATVVGTMIGDMLAALVGFTDITDFIDNAALLAQAIVDFSDVVDKGAVDSVAIELASTAGTQIGTMMTSFGVWTDMTDFINNAALLAQAIVDFSTNVKDGVDLEAVKTATSAGTSIGTMIGSLNGWSDPTVAITHMGDLATGIVDFSSKVQNGVDPAWVGIAVSAGTQIGSMLKQMPPYSDVSSAINSMSDLATSLVDFSKTIGGLDFTPTSITMSGFQAMVISFGDIATQAINGFVDTLSNAKSKINDAISGFASAATSKMKSYYGGPKTGFYGAGKYLVQGFAQGIKNNSYIATAAAEYVCKAAMQVAKDILGINSPSKVFMKIGKSIPEGFAIGIKALDNVVDGSVISMASNALNGTRSMMSKIADYVETDIDSQPTIRPVLDLSDVTSGASRINGLFNMNPSVGVLSNIGSISAMMNANGQNGANDDVISAIKDLGTALSKSGGDTYQINGITYDDDSSVADAIRTLTRAARMERRV